MVIEALNFPQRKVWDITVADFDGDGRDDFFPAGHHGRHHDRIYFARGGSYQPSAFSFPRTADRHGCAAADIDGDDSIDIYCGQGADRGVGSRDNELWLGESNDRFSRLRGAAGAAYATSRARYVTFLNANGDSWPDLYVSTWGERGDDAANDSALFLNRAGSFEGVDSAVNGKWGGRCLAAGDLTGNGLDDLAVCGEAEGALLFLNFSGRYVKLHLPWPRRWWKDVEIVDLDGDGVDELLGMITGPTGGSLLSYRVTLGDTLDDTVVSSLEAISLASVFGDCFPRSLASADGNGDGAVDLLITREAAGAPGRHCETGSDAILLGPDWRRFVALETPAMPQANTAFAVNGDFILAYAAQDAAGGLALIRLRPRAR